MSLATTSPRVVAVLGVAAVATMLHAAVVLDSVTQLMDSSPHAAVMILRVIGFGLLAALAAGCGLLALRAPSFWIPALVVAIAVLALAFSDLRSLDLTPI